MLPFKTLKLSFFSVPAAHQYVQFSIVSQTIKVVVVVVIVVVVIVSVDVVVSVDIVVTVVVVDTIVGSRKLTLKCDQNQVRVK